MHNSGVAIANKCSINNRPASICTDPEGMITTNAQLTARLLVLSMIEIILLVDYLFCGIGFQEQTMR